MAIHIIPTAFVLAKGGALVMCLRLTELEVVSDELDDPFFVLRAACLNVNDRQPLPVGALCPRGRACTVDVRAAARVGRLEDVIEQLLRVRAVARAHEGQSGGCRLARVAGPAASFVGVATLARARIKPGHTAD